MAPQTRGIVPEPDVQRIKAALVLRDEAQQQVELAVADALKAGGSVREVAASTGVSTTTVQRYGRRHGWPTSEQQAGWEAEQAGKTSSPPALKQQQPSWPFSAKVWTIRLRLKNRSCRGTFHC